MSQKVVVGVVFVAAMFMSIMDATIVNVALPTIGRDFKVSPSACCSSTSPGRTGRAGSTCPASCCPGWVWGC
jgi:hypothetical protein